MTFLEAHKALTKVRDLPVSKARIIGSCTLDSVSLFTRALFASNGVNLELETLPFGTFHQHLASGGDDTPEVAFLLPWDLCGAVDWRNGVPNGEVDQDAALAGAARTMRQVKERCRGAAVYLDAPVLPVLRNADDQALLASALRSLAQDAGVTVLSATLFSLTSYLSTGAPVSGMHLDEVAFAIADSLRSASERGRMKVLVTDLDNCLWQGTVGEDGPENVSADAEGSSYRHFIYQTFLRRLRQDGIILAIASRNDGDLARNPLERSDMILGIEDFVAIEAGYGAKSDALRTIASALNLGLDSFVFIDDNPVELAEVRSALPDVTTLAFPTDDQELPGLLARLNNMFHRERLTDEDRRRHEFYRNRSILVEQAQAATSLEDFLSGLNMKMEIFSRTPSSWIRAIQLINKTNQFNLNGRRWSEDEVACVVEDGGRLLTAKLSDNTGEHGEIISFLMDKDGTARAFVMSCRVFQRRVEHAFLLALTDMLPGELSLEYAPTDRNTPFSMFIDDPAFSHDDSTLRCNLERLRECHADVLGLFTIERFDDGV